jgi:glycosyltransferase involved in cell wall biosynthesis
VVLAPPAIAENRMTGLRCTAADAGALATALGRMLATPEASRQAIGQRGRAWVLDHFDEATVADSLLRLYAGVIGADALPPVNPAI